MQRPALRYFGGKARLADWIIACFPPHTCYVEPFGGGANVLLRKPPSYIEVYNDLNSEVVNFFDMLRTRPDDLIRAIGLTPFSREIQQRSFEMVNDPFESALRFYIRCWQSFGAGGVTNNSGWRFQRGTARGKALIGEWRDVEHLWMIADRLLNVQFEHDDALSVIRRFDRPDTLFYIDPPYVHGTRAEARNTYPHEMTDDQHRELADILHGVVGKVVLSGYASTLYTELYDGWRRLDKSTTTNGNGQAKEALWLSPAAVALDTLPLFAGVKTDD